MVSRYGAKKVGSKECKIVCIYHDDNNPSLQINTELGIFHCWGCHESGKVQKLIADIECISLNEANDICKDFGFGQNKSEFVKVGNAYSFKKKIIKPLDESILANFFPLRLNPYIEYLENRGIDIKIAKTYGFMEGKPSENNWRGRVVYPIRNIDGQLFGIKGRSIRPNADLRYYQEGDQGSVHGLFGASHIFSSRKRKVPYLVITEGVFDSLSFTMNKEHSVALNGTYITDSQISQIKKITDVPVIVLDGLKDNKTNTVNTRRLVMDQIQSALSKHFSKYLIHTIEKNQVDPNKMHVSGKLGSYFNSHVKNKKEFKALFK
jgi:DNA primase